MRRARFLSVRVRYGIVVSFELRQIWSCEIFIIVVPRLGYLIFGEAHFDSSTRMLAELRRPIKRETLRNVRTILLAGVSQSISPRLCVEAAAHHSTEANFPAENESASFAVAAQVRRWRSSHLNQHFFVVVSFVCRQVFGGHSAG